MHNENLISLNHLNERLNAIIEKLKNANNNEEILTEEYIKLNSLFTEFSTLINVIKSDDNIPLDSYPAFNVALDTTENYIETLDPLIIKITETHPIAAVRSKYLELCTSRDYKDVDQFAQGRTPSIPDQIAATQTMLNSLPPELTQQLQGLPIFSFFAPNRNTPVGMIGFIQHSVATPLNVDNSGDQNNEPRSTFTP